MKLFLKNFNYEVLLLVFLLFSANLPKYFIFSILLIYLLVNFKSYRFYTMFFMLVFFESLLDINFLGLNFSFFRIYQAFFVVKIPHLIFTIHKHKYIFSQFKIETMLFLVFLITILNFSSSITDIFSFFSNMIIVYLITIFFMIGNLGNRILFTIIFSTLVSGLYGLINDYTTAYSGLIDRYFSLIGDPNYSSFQYLFALFAIGLLKNKFLKTLLFLSFSFLIMSTISATAILIYFFIITVYLFLYKFKFFLLFVSIGILLSTYFINASFLSDTLLGSIQQRILLLLSDNDLSVITTGRSTLFFNYFNYFLNNLTLSQKLFGGTNIVYGELSQQLRVLFFNVSHNTFLDMLFSLGIIFFSIFMICFLLKIFKLVLSKNILGLSFLSLVIFMFSISIYPYRFFYILFLLKPSINPNKISSYFFS
jgi:hypothetical protein